MTRIFKNRIIKIRRVKIDFELLLEMMNNDDINSFSQVKVGKWMYEWHFQEIQFHFVRKGGIDLDCKEL